MKTMVISMMVAMAALAVSGAASAKVDTQAQLGGNCNGMVDSYCNVKTCEKDPVTGAETCEYEPCTLWTGPLECIIG